MLNNIRAGLLSFEGTVEKIVYKNLENAYTVLVLKIEKQGSIVAVGEIFGVDVGQTLKIYGKFKIHKNFGKQFCVINFEQIVPSNETSMFKYLSSGAIKGIGKAKAKLIIEAFGSDALNIIESEPRKLATVKGVTYKKAEEISKNFKKNTELRNIVLKLSKFDISPKVAVKIYEKFKNNSMEKIQSNPYILMGEPFFVDFKKCDRIFFTFENQKTNNVRLRAVFFHVLMTYCKTSGSTCLKKSELIEMCVNFTELEAKNLQEILTKLLQEETLISFRIRDNEFISLPEIFKCENFIANRLKLMLKLSTKSIKNLESYLKNIEKDSKIKYAEKQKKAIKFALEPTVMILTGGPGTGKTTTLKGIIKILRQNALKVFCAAPTGKAAKRMQDLTNLKSKTLHRLLNARPDPADNSKSVFGFCKDNPLKCEALIVDELSMVDIFMFKAILEALPIGARLILVGDENQLPSIGIGNVLTDLIASKKIKIVKLEKIFRQSMKSLIIKNAHAIIKKRELDLDNRKNDFFFLETTNVSEIKSIILDLCTIRLPRFYNFSSINDIQVISPIKKGFLGVEELNKDLQNSINPLSDKKSEITVGQFKFREGDKVIQIKNNYDIKYEKSNNIVEQGIFNGDVGVIKKVDFKKTSITVNFDDRIVEYESSNFSELSLAWAISVHKSQGSEFNAVVIPIFSGPSQLLSNKLFYTAITRAKCVLILVGKRQVIFDMVKNTESKNRYSLLKYLLDT
ncbi:MAG: ATP-dependent RecD-like DNA helicase [Oscillospiraceae bacterium]|jgi:exodeoxyribonuclease V alpha subunit|nr:ATP-dependent RecD-like DNA helicase [Oscillospiraceae bacterium]